MTRGASSIAAPSLTGPSFTGPSLTVRVADVVEVTPLVKRFRFVPVSTSELPAFSGGAHITVAISDGYTIKRNAYSLMGSPRDLSSYAISVSREEAGRGGSRSLHDLVAPGTILQISFPFNLFPLRQDARKHLMIAGGIGITPFLAMGEQLLVERRTFELHYSVPSLARGPYLDEVRQRFGRRASTYVGERGERLSIEGLLSSQPLGTHVYVCGPQRLADAVLATARRFGWPEAALHSERFTAPRSGQPFRVELDRSRRFVDVGAHQSMLEAIEAAGIEVPFLCRGGVCGQCQTKVLAHDGVLLHEDHYLGEDEKASGSAIMPCVSRFTGRRLVVDL